MRELITLGGGGFETKMAIIVLVEPRWNHHNISDFQCVFSDKHVVSLNTFIESDALEKCSVFDRNKHFFRLNSCKISICSVKMESYISR